MELRSFILDEPRSILREDVIFFFKRTLARICYILFMTNHDTRELAAQLVASWFWKTRVAGSNLFYPTSIIFINHLIFSKGQKEKKRTKQQKQVGSAIGSCWAYKLDVGCSNPTSPFFYFCQLFNFFSKGEKKDKIKGKIKALDACICKILKIVGG